MRSVFLHKDKSIFKIDELPAERFAESLGLPGAPKIKFLSKELAKKRKNVSHVIESARAEAGVIPENDDSADEREVSAVESESQDEGEEVPDSSKSEATKKVSISITHSRFI